MGQGDRLLQVPHGCIVGLFKVPRSGNFGGRLVLIEHKPLVHQEFGDEERIEEHLLGSDLRPRVAGHGDLQHVVDHVGDGREPGGGVGVVEEVEDGSSLSWTKF